MPKTLAYVRISDGHKQQNATQKQRITDYAIKNALIIDRWIEYSLSASKTSRSERGIEQLLLSLKPGDNLLISDIDRLGRTTITDIVEIVTRIINGQATLHICYSGAKLGPDDANDLAKIFLTLGEAYAAVKFATERAYKAKAAIERRKRQGLHNGRQKGAIVSSKLDPHEKDIITLSANNMSEYAISEHLGVDRTTLRRWKATRSKLITHAKEIGIWQPHLSLIDIKKLLKSSPF